MATADLLAPPPSAPRRDPSPRLWTATEFERMRHLGLFGERTVELIHGTVVERAGDGSTAPFVFTRKEYYALDDHGFFRDQRVQLIGGVVWQETKRVTPRNAATIGLTWRACQSVFHTGFDVCCRLPLTLSALSEPEPDVSVVVGSPRDYLTEHPKTALLVVEVSDSTIEEDTHRKASLYATAGIADYWVIDLTTDRVLVFHNPAPEAGSAFGHNYASVSAFCRDDNISPLAAPTARVLAGELLP